MSGVDGRAVIDRAAIERLTRLGGAALARQMIDLFMEHAAERLDAVRGGVDGPDVKSAERGAHSLKSTAGNLGAERLMEAARQVEDAASAGDHDRVAALFDTLDAALQEALASLRTIHAELGT
ncbi:MAG: Hpt domain-containing protein [Gemmatimonadota bacterium]